MTTENNIDNTITALKVISMVGKNGRLSVRKGHLTLESEDTMQKFRRWFNKDSRDQTLIHIKNTIHNAMQLSTGLKARTIQTELKEWTFQCLHTEMQNCQAGLMNLKTTYNDDPLFKASIEVIHERLNAHCKELMSDDQYRPEHEEKCNSVLMSDAVVPFEL
jgi:hypothetical protein